MYGYHEFVVEALQSARAQSAGYQVSPSVSLEITLESIAQEFKEQRRLDKEAKKNAHRTAFAVFWNTTKAAFRHHATIAE